MNGDASFGAWLSRRRRSLDLTQEELARKANCSTSAIRKIEADERRPSAQVAQLLAEALRITDDQREVFLRAARGDARVDRLAEPVSPAHEPPPLPLPPAPLVGRETELNYLKQLLRNPECRLLTLIGPGGIGKTRLALEAARSLREEFKDGARFIALAPLNTAEFVPPTIAEAVGCSFNSASDPREQLLACLAPRSLLLVMDNFEHLLEGAELLQVIVEHSPGTKVLATSRERLDLLGEWVFEVDGLPVPPVDDVAHPEDYSSVHLFMQSARRIRIHFAPGPGDLQAVARVCRLLDGMPLGIELAASWVRVLSCQEIAREIEHDLDFLKASGRDLPPRHRSLRAVFDHSWQLLDDHERLALERLSVFRGGFTREAAARVTGATLQDLAALVNHSLLRRGEGGRYEVHELIRQFGTEKLQAGGEEEAIRHRHMQYYLRVAEQAEPQFDGPNAAESFTQLEQESANLRAALAWGVQSDAESALKMAAALRPVWMRRYMSEGREWLAKAMRAAEGDFKGDLKSGPAGSPTVNPMAWARALWVAALLSGDAAERISFAQKAYETARACGDQTMTAYNLQLLTLDHWRHGHCAGVHEAYEECMALLRATGDQVGQSSAMAEYAAFERYQGNYARSRELQEESLAIAREIGQRELTADGVMHLAILDMRTGNYTRAKALLQEGMALWYEIGSDLETSWALMVQGRIAMYQAEYDVANRVLEEAIAISHRIGAVGYSGYLDLSLISLGDVAILRGEPGAAAKAFAEVAAFLEPDNFNQCLLQLSMGHVARLQGDTAQAEALLASSISLAEQYGMQPDHALSLHGLATLRLDQRLDSEAQALFTQALQEAHTVGDRWNVAQCLEGLAYASARQNVADRAVTLLGAAASLRKEMGAPLPPVYRESYEACLKATQSSLGQSAFDAARACGAALTVNQAVAFAV